MRARMTLALLVSVGILLAACGGSTAPAPAAAASSAAPSATPLAIVKVRASYGNITPANFAPFAAQEGGYFKQNGLDVDLQLIESGSKSMAALLSNQVDVASLGGTETMSAYVGGADVFAAALFVPVSPWALYVPASYKEPSDLKGKTLGIVTKGGSSEIALLACLKQINIDPNKDVTITAIGGVPALASAMIAGAVYGGPGHPPDTTVLTKAGFKIAVDLAKQKVPATDNAMVTTRTYANANNAVVQRYVDSLVQAVARGKKDKPFAINVLRKMLNLNDEAALGETYDFYVTAIFPTYPHTEVAAFIAARDGLVATNPKVKDLDVTKVIDDSYVQDAEKRKVADKP